MVATIQMHALRMATTPTAERLAQQAAEQGSPPLLPELFEHLFRRERLGMTTTSMPNCKGKIPLSVFGRLQELQVVLPNFMKDGNVQAT